ncbi:MAG: Ig-like domain-containing protein, partial [Cyclobacteriaceae bacterium]|nr:Ig-like domain-containing protein [Cyclobacteriaceae bacterium]
MMKKLLFAYFFLIQFFGLAQFTDQFSDGELTTNPLWSGDVTNFTVSLDSLRSNGPAATASIYLSTPTTLIYNTVWEFSIKLDFAPSASNQVNVYLVADNATLTTALNGYYISIGQAGDDQIKLYKQTGNTSILLFTGSSLFTTSPVKTRIKVVRDNVGNWEVLADNTGGVNFVSEGAGFFDDTFQTTSFFGVVCNHTSTRKDLFYFDDFSVASLPDTNPPSVMNANVISYTEIDVIFDEPISTTTAELITNYTVNGNIGNPVLAIVDGLDNTIVHLTFPVAFTNNTGYVLTTQNIEDINSNVMPISNTNFTFLIPDIAAIGDIIINEFMADPNPPIGLPDAEFV